MSDRVLMLQVVLFTIVEMYNEGDTINHHGFKRKVGDTKDSNTMMEFSASTYYKIAKTVGRR